MVPTNKGSYEFKPGSLADIRNKLKISQAEMARQIGVPPNTLSRWENRATVPDAKSLASIFSLAKDNGLTPNFFGIRKDTKKQQKIRDRLIVMWDFWTLGLQANQVEKGETWVKSELKKRFHHMTVEMYKAFSHPSQSSAADKLIDLGWKVWEEPTGMDDELIDHTRSDAGQDPKATILILITRDNQFIDLISEMHKKGVRVYLISPSNTSEKLIEEVGEKRWIEWEDINFWISLPILRY